MLEMSIYNFGSWKKLWQNKFDSYAQPFLRRSSLWTHKLEITWKISSSQPAVVQPACNTQGEDDIFQVISNLSVQIKKIGGRLNIFCGKYEKVEFCRLCSIHFLQLCCWFCRYGVGGFTGCFVCGCFANQPQ